LCKIKKYLKMFLLFGSLNFMKPDFRRYYLLKKITGALVRLNFSLLHFSS
jgi:hypothetical protein